MHRNHRACRPHIVARRFDVQCSPSILKRTDPCPVPPPIRTYFDETGTPMTQQKRTLMQPLSALCPRGYPRWKTPAQDILRDRILENHPIAETNGRRIAVDLIAMSALWPDYVKSAALKQAGFKDIGLRKGQEGQGHGVHDRWRRCILATSYRPEKLRVSYNWRRFVRATAGMGLRKCPEQRPAMMPSELNCLRPVGPWRGPGPSVILFDEISGNRARSLARGLAFLDVEETIVDLGKCPGSIHEGVNGKTDGQSSRWCQSCFLSLIERGNSVHITTAVLTHWLDCR